ncbi:hypothetical protein ACK3SF_00395 [Candidatus Nanosalina sp. VS9-1]|uniref:hypothetical protein n=1 Tax=Candidatus Nanosalina sp. VS9-1 TaxID=3388566 RepID=UPI0039E1743D
MDQRFTVLTLLISVVVFSGCIGGGGNTSSGGGQAITVTGIQAQPTEIFAGENVRVSAGLKNTGQLPAEVLVGDQGSQIMTSHCPDIFDVASFSATSSNVSETRQSYDLASDYEVRLNWNLAQTSDDVPLNGYRCNLRFEVPFNYSVESFSQIQIKESSEVDGAEQLFSQTSRGPLDIEIEAIGSSAPSGAPTFIDGDGAEVLVRLVNQEPTQSSYTGTINLKPPVMIARGIQFSEVDITQDNVEAAKVIARRLPDMDPGDIQAGDQVRMCPDPDTLSGNAGLALSEGQSKIFRCGLEWDLNNAPSIRGEIFARSDYTFVKNAGNQQINVRYRGQ